MWIEKHVLGSDSSVVRGQVSIMQNYENVEQVYIIEGSLEVKLPTMDRWKSWGGKSQGGEEKKWGDQRRERTRSQKMQVREKGREVAILCFFQWFVALEGRKAGVLKRRVRSQLAR